jgi:hypothetical protein
MKFGYILRFRVLRATDFKIFEKTHAALINIKNFEYFFSPYVGY